MGSASPWLPPVRLDDVVATTPNSCKVAKVTITKYMPRVRLVTRLRTAAARAATRPPARQPTNGEMFCLAARIPVV
jgi:hypothetical protein